MWANGGDLFAKEGAESIVISESNKRTLAFFHQMYKDGLMSPLSKADSSLNDGFATGKNRPWLALARLP